MRSGFESLRCALFQHNLSTNGRSKPLPYRDINIFAFSACRAWWQNGGRCRKSIDVFLPSPLCSAAMPREIQEGTSWFPFFRPFFVERQRKGNIAFTERAKLCEAQGEVVRNSAFFPSSAAQRAAVSYLSLLASQQEVTKKCAKGPNAP